MAVPNDDYLIRVQSGSDSALGDEVVQWFQPSREPSDNRTVLIHTPGLVWPGYFEQGRGFAVGVWRWAEGGIVEQEVIEWAEMPRGSK